MGNMINVIAATAIGSMFLLTILSGIFNAQAIAFNAKMQVTLAQVSEDVIEILDTYYLSRVGLGVSSNEITSALDSSFEFKSCLDDATGDDTEYTILITKDGNDDLVVYRNGAIDFGPFELSDNTDNLKFTYFKYDSSTGGDIEVASPDSNKEDILSVEVDIEFQYQTYKMESGKDYVRHIVKFWSYFKNLYI